MAQRNNNYAECAAFNGGGSHGNQGQTPTKAVHQTVDFYYISRAANTCMILFTPIILCLLHY